MDKKVMCMQKSVKKGKNMYKKLHEGGIKCKGGRNQGGTYAKKAFMRENIQGKCLTRGKMYATKAFHKGKIKMKKTVMTGKGKRCVGGKLS